MFKVGHQPDKGSTGCPAWDGGLQSGALTPNGSYLVMSGQEPAQAKGLLGLCKAHLG